MSQTTGTRGIETNGRRFGANRVKLAALVILALYAACLFAAGVAYGNLEAGRRLESLAALGAVALAGHLWPRLGGLILTLLTLVVGAPFVLISFLLDPLFGVVMLVFVTPLFVAGLLFLMAERHARAAARQSKIGASAP